MTTDLDLALLDSPSPLSVLAFTQAEQAPAGDPNNPPPGDGKTSTSPLGGLMLPMILVFAIFYFVMIGPERKARKRREAMLAAVKKGDKVLTTGGMFATVAAIADDMVTLQIDDGVRVRFSRSAIQSVLDGESTAGDSKAAK